MGKRQSIGGREPVRWEVTMTLQLEVGWKQLPNGERRVGKVGFRMEAKDLPKPALEQWYLLTELRVAALRCVWPASRVQARWGARSTLAMTHGLAPHLPWFEGGGARLLGILAGEATVMGDLGFMRALIDDMETLRKWRRTDPAKMSTANRRRIEAVTRAFDEIRHGRWFTKAQLSEHLDRAGLGTDAAHLARDIFKLPGLSLTPKQPRRR